MRKAVVFACILSPLAVAVMMLGCGSSEKTSTRGTPEEVAEAFWNAALKGEADTSRDLFSKSMKAGLESKEGGQGAEI